MENPQRTQVIIGPESTWTQATGKKSTRGLPKRSTRKTGSTDPGLRRDVRTMVDLNLLHWKIRKNQAINFPGFRPENCFTCNSPEHAQRQCPEEVCAHCYNKKMGRRAIGHTQLDCPFLPTFYDPQPGIPRQSSTPETAPTPEIFLSVPLRDRKPPTPLPELQKREPTAQAILPEHEHGRQPDHRARGSDPDLPDEDEILLLQPHSSGQRTPAQQNARELENTARSGQKTPGIIRLPGNQPPQQKRPVTGAQTQPPEETETSQQNRIEITIRDRNINATYTPNTRLSWISRILCDSLGIETCEVPEWLSRQRDAGRKNRTGNPEPATRMTFARVTGGKGLPWIHVFAVTEDWIETEIGTIFKEQYALVNNVSPEIRNPSTRVTGSNL